MPHLLLDLAQSPTPKRKIPYHHAKVSLFATFKAAKRMITPEEPHSIYVLPRKKATLSIAQAAADILQHQPQAAIAIVSPRKKLRPYLHQLQIKYPLARLLHKKKLGKATRQFLKQAQQSPLAPTADGATREHSETQTTKQKTKHPKAKNPNEQQLIHRAAQSVQQAVAQIIPAPPANQVFTLLATQETRPSSPINTALALLKKNRPKKKQDLLRLLTERSNPKLAQEMLVALQSAGKIHIDAAENVRYR